MTSSPEFDALIATTQLEREIADGIKSLVSSAKATAKWQHRAEVAEAALVRVEMLCDRWNADSRIYGDDRDDRADALDQGADLIRDAMKEPTS